MNLHPTCMIFYALYALQIIQITEINLLQNMLYLVNGEAEY